MKTRHVYSTPDLPAARAAMDAARDNGIANTDLLLVANAEIELDSIPDQRKEADTNFMSAAARGAGLGGTLGAVGGLIAVVTPLGVTLLGAAAIAAAAAMVGSWASALAGASQPDPIRQRFEEEIAAGKILLVVDGEDEALARVGPTLIAAGATLLPFESTTALV